MSMESTNSLRSSMHVIIIHSSLYDISFITEISEDLSLGSVTFLSDSTINDMECADIQVMADNILESVEEFSIFVSNSVTMVEDFEADFPAASSDPLEVDTSNFRLTLPCDNATISIATSDTNG